MSRLARLRGARGTAVEGDIDRTLNGLVSGWLHCPACAGGADGTSLSLTVDDVVVDAERQPTPRPDVPGGHGFVLRFDPVPTGTNERLIVRVCCSEHPTAVIVASAARAQWDIPALGRIEFMSWPMVTGWIAHLTTKPAPAFLRIGADRQATVRGTVPRPDVQDFLGRRGVMGFQIDLGSVLGYAVPDGTAVTFEAGGQVLETTTVRDSPLGTLEGGCERPILEDGQWHAARPRLSVTEGPHGNGSWFTELEGLGIVDHANTTRQWAEYLQHRGLSNSETARLLARRAMQGLGVPSVDPVPDTGRLWIEQIDGVAAARIRSWSRDIAPEPIGPARPGSMALDAVCVAGLVGHRSGLGQNAAHSIRVLSDAGLHVCRAPFFPGPGGWNRDLALESDAASRLAGHAVLLHLPVDRVVQSLSAQPALLASPRLIGYFMWETDVIPRSMHRSLRLVDEVWTATEFVADAVRAVTDRPVHVTGHAVDVSAVAPVTRRELGIADDAFVVHFSFDANSTVARKNPNAAIDAFHRAFDHDPSAVFVLKVRNMQQAEHLARQGDPHAVGMMRRLEEDPAIVLLAGEWTHGHSLGLIELADCFLSLHRSEGYGYAMVEAMALGTPVIATDYSGNRDFLSADDAWLVPAKLVDVLPEEYFYWESGMQWADADVDAAAQALREVRTGTGVNDRVAVARTRAAKECSLQALQDAYVRSLA